jgi:hypothetical protein
MLPTYTSRLAMLDYSLLLINLAVTLALELLKVLA